MEVKKKVTSESDMAYTQQTRHSRVGGTTTSSM